MSDMTNNRDILMQHYTKPTNFFLLEGDDIYQRRLKSDSCADEIFLQIKAKDNHFEQLAWTGSACVIASSSVDILCSLLKDKSFDQSKAIIDDYLLMIEKGDQPSSQLEDLKVLVNVHNQKGRWTCATLGVKGVVEFLENK